MAGTVREDQREPLTYASAPTVDVDGVTYVDVDAGATLARSTANEYSALLARLAKK